MNRNLYYLAAVAVLDTFSYQHYQTDFSLEECLLRYFDEAVNGTPTTPEMLSHFKGDAFGHVASDVINTLARFVLERDGEGIEQVCEDVDLGLLYVE